MYTVAVYNCHFPLTWCIQITFPRQTLLSSSVRAEPPVFYPSLYDSDDENADEEELAENENCVEPPATEGR